MKKDAVAKILIENRKKLDLYRISALFLFGSVARDSAGPSSDVDILVEFEPDTHIGLFGFARLQRTLSEIVGRPVDLVTKDALHKRFRDEILKKAIRAA